MTPEPLSHPCVDMTHQGPSFKVKINFHAKPGQVHAHVNWLALASNGAMADQSLPFEFRPGLKSQPQNHGGLGTPAESPTPTLLHKIKNKKSILAIAVADAKIYAGTQGGEILVMNPQSLMLKTLSLTISDLVIEDL